MKCSKCGTSNSNEAKFCRNCGTELNKTSNSTVAILWLLFILLLGWAVYYHFGNSSNGNNTKENTSSEIRKDDFVDVTKKLDEARRKNRENKSN